MLRVALPNKGRLADEARELFEDAGLGVRIQYDRALIATLGSSYEAIFVRAQDIPEFVADGAADAGVTGFDLVRESGRDLVERLDLGFGRCRLVVAARDETGIEAIGDIPAGARVATVFPRSTTDFFRRLDRAVDVVPVSGATEIAPHLGIADLVVDLVATGSTLKINGLREIVTIFDSTARLVSGPRANGSAERAAALDELVTRLESVVRARGQRYVMANVPRSELDRVKTVLPGLNGPTVVDILNGGRMVAVHAVVPAADLDRVIAGVKALGGEGILVTRIERLLP